MVHRLLLLYCLSIGVREHPSSDFVPITPNHAQHILLQSQHEMLDGALKTVRMAVPEHHRKLSLTLNAFLPKFTLAVPASSSLPLSIAAHPVCNPVTCCISKASCQVTQVTNQSMVLETVMTVSTWLRWSWHKLTGTTPYANQSNRFSQFFFSCSTIVLDFLYSISSPQWC